MPDEVNDNLDKGESWAAKIHSTFTARPAARKMAGASGRFPPLAGTDWVTGDKKRLIGILLKGLESTIDVKMARPISMQCRSAASSAIRMPPMCLPIFAHTSATMPPLAPAEVAAVRGTLPAE